MFIAHLPSGYIFAKVILNKLKKLPPSTVIFTMMLGAIFPDIDLLYFFFIDHQQNHHHKYFLHWPIVWFGLFILSGIFWKCTAYHSDKLLISLLFSAAAILHVLLDTLVGDIWWFAPFVDQAFALFKVEAQYQPWWLNFILHWSFWIEVLICLCAVVIYLKSK